MNDLLLSKITFSVSQSHLSKYHFFTCQHPLVYVYVSLIVFLEMQKKTMSSLHIFMEVFRFYLIVNDS